MSRKLFSQFSAVFIGIKNRKETILIPTSVNFAWHKVRLIVQVQKYCFLFGEVIGIFLSDCNTVETWQHAMDSSYQVIYSNCWTWNHFCLAPRNLSKSRGLSISPVTILLISLPRYSVEACKNNTNICKLDHFSKACLSQLNRDLADYSSFLELPTL